MPTTQNRRPGDRAAVPPHIAHRIIATPVPLKEPSPQSTLEENRRQVERFGNSSLARKFGGNEKDQPGNQHWKAES